MNATLYVPIGSKEKYEEVDPWRNFWNIKEMAYTDIDNSVTINKSFVTIEKGTIYINNTNGEKINLYKADGTCIYSGYDTSISNLAKGIYILKYMNKISKIYIP